MVVFGLPAAIPTSNASISARVAVCMLNLSARPRATGKMRSTRLRVSATRLSVTRIFLILFRSVSSSRTASSR